jgi:hypothetical protein
MLNLKCQQYHLNPSDELGLQNRWVRHQFNGAVAYVGRYVQSKIEEAQSKKRKPNIEQILSPRIHATNDLSTRFLMQNRDVWDGGA